MANKKRICVICGKEYEYCPRCEEYKLLPLWMFAYCSEPCKDVDMTVNKYECGHITAQEALDKLDELKVKIANKAFLKTIDAIKKEAKPKKKAASEKKDEAEV